MSLPKKQHNNTSKDHWGLPEGTRAELIGNQLYVMAPPDDRHYPFYPDAAHLPARRQRLPQMRQPSCH